ncbi:TRAP transporter small permease [Rhizobium sp. NTR19]|uniref:TRAP transporter small permease protein n=1 Tax=Neorhizobium turbinariae TaxID=2937795 RepID=A0ABT0INS0_9HYPH|nr:TRAP transporter small permease [Neorhizobium turbinariae]MCK8779512.1 TRAP transporter small permease [Neorhizobium turbinariae]
MADAETRSEARLFSLARSVITGWALLGGVVTLAVVVVQTASVVTGIFGAPVPGDFELTELGIAVAVFAFLPYCQLTDANVTADIFTSGLGKRTQSALVLLSSVIALVFAILMAWRTWLGAENQFDYDYQTAILQIRIGYAFIAIVISLILLTVAAIITIVESYQGVVTRSQNVITDGP